MTRTWGLWLAMAAMVPSSAWATACDLKGDGEVNCERVGRLTSVNDSQTNDFTGGYSCDPSNQQDGPERIMPFSCETSSMATIVMGGTECDIDFFVVDDECDPSDTCIASNTQPYNASPNRYQDTFFCEAGRQYYIIVEGWAITQNDFLLQISGSPVCPMDICVGGSGPGCTGGTIAKGSRFSMVAECTEICDDGHDNDRDDDIDCDDDDCIGDPACAGAVEDCETPGDEDGNGAADCIDPACSETDFCCDVDGDGVYADNPYCGDGGDCDDDNVDAYPNAPEVINDGIDQDCDGGDDCYIDMDEDTFGSGVGASPDLSCDGAFEAIRGGDCDDNVFEVNPDATELVANGVDDDCNGTEICYVDGDGDGYGTPATTPSAILTCIGSNLSPRSDDCQDGVFAVNPGATELVGNDVDENCDGHDDCYVDADKDTYGTSQVVPSLSNVCLTDNAEAKRPGDCRDDEPSANPAATEIPYDGIDNDCVDGDVSDVDGDGFDGGPGGADCDDGNGAIKPGATEIVANGIDEDCDGFDDCYVDGDGDGFGTANVATGTTLDCSATGESRFSTDCDDADGAINPAADEVPYDGDDNDCLDGDLTDIDGDGFAGGTNGPDCSDFDVNVFPGATEVPDGIDQDCNGIVDDTTTWGDDDGDGFAEAGGDCNDALAAVNPGATELANGRDDDCDGLTDEGTTAYDDDEDGFTENQGDCHDGDASIYPGAPESPTSGIDSDCDGSVPGGDDDGDGYAVHGGDCNNQDANVYPGAPEAPNGVDDDCDGTIDEGTRNYDDDRDGLSETEGDCDDTNADRSPTAPEVLGNHIDDDCDGKVDEGGNTYDDDGDGYSELEGDCDDTDPNRAPLRAELANGVDDDCDGLVDEGLTDLDGDRYTPEQGDCDDTNGWIHPGLIDVCDGYDNDCDGDVDEDCSVDPVVETPPTDPEAAGCGCSQSGGLPMGWLWLAGIGLVWRRR